MKGTRMKRKEFKHLFLLCLLLFYAAPVPAHPHVFITPEVRMIKEGDVLKEVKVRWVFDRMTSISMLEYLDKNRDGLPDENMVKKISREVFPALSIYGYYTFISIDGGENMEINPKNFIIKIEEGETVIYEFEIPVGQKMNTKVSVYFEDEEIYTAFDFYPGNFYVTDESGGKAEFGINEKESAHSNIVEAVF